MKTALASLLMALGAGSAALPEIKPFQFSHDARLGISALPLADHITLEFGVCVEGAAKLKSMPMRVRCLKEELVRQETYLGTEMSQHLLTLPAAEAARFQTDQQTWLRKRISFCRAQTRTAPRAIRLASELACNIEQTVRRRMWLAQNRA